MGDPAHQAAPVDAVLGVRDARRCEQAQQAKQRGQKT
jgi:hypothetical protein